MFASFNARAVGLAGLDPEETIKIAVATGFAGVDLMVRDIVQSGVDPREVRAQLDQNGLRAGAFPFPFDWRTDEAGFLENLARLKPILQAAQILGLTRTGTWVMPELPDRNSNRREVVALHVRRLGMIARVLAEFDIKLGLEVIGVESFRTGRGEPFVCRMGDLDRELGAIWAESPNLGILVDAFHLYAADESTEAAFAWGVDRVIWVHIADLPPDSDGARGSIIDANRGLPGENGAVKIRGLLTRLQSEGYDGPVTVEPLSQCRSILGLEPRAVAGRVKQSLDKVWP